MKWNWTAILFWASEAYKPHLACVCCFHPPMSARRKDVWALHGIERQPTGEKVIRVCLANTHDHKFKQRYSYQPPGGTLMNKQEAIRYICYMEKIKSFCSPPSAAQIILDQDHTAQHTRHNPDVYKMPQDFRNDDICGDEEPSCSTELPRVRKWPFPSQPAWDTVLNSKPTFQSKSSYTSMMSILTSKESALNLPIYNVKNIYNS